MALTEQEFITMARYLMASKMYSLAAFVMALYDICITFDQEVERIWKRRLTPLSVLYLVNRYFPPMCYAVITCSYHMAWSTESCRRYIYFPGLSRIVWTFAVGCIFILRVYAIFTCDKRVLYVGGVMLTSVIVVKIWATLDGTNLPLPGGLIGCILTGKSKGYRIASTWAAELIFDFIVFVVTLLRVIALHRVDRRMKSSLLSLIHKDGITYFGIIFSANLLSLLIYTFAPPGIKVINASFSALLTSVMVNRLILNLRGAVATLTPLTPSKPGNTHNIPMSPLSGHQYIIDTNVPDSPGLTSSHQDQTGRHPVEDIRSPKRKSSTWWDFTRV